MKQCYSPSSDDAARNPRSRIRNLALALLIALFTLPVLAQGGKSVSGSVKGPDGRPVIGATVIVSGTPEARQPMPTVSSPSKLKRVNH